MDSQQININPGEYARGLHFGTNNEWAFTGSPTINMKEIPFYENGQRSQFRLSWEAIHGAVGYTVYTQQDLDRLKRVRLLQHVLHKKFNKRKKQRRALTGRRK